MKLPRCLLPRGGIQSPSFNSRPRSRARACAALAGTVLVCSGPFALAQRNVDDGDVAAYAGTRVTYDTNLFRVDNALENSGAVDPRGLADTMFTAYAGVDWDWLLRGDQKITLTGEVDANFQDKYSEADYTGGSLLLQYDWKLGAATYGDITLTSAVDRVDFENQDVPIINFRDTTRLGGSLNRKFSPRWAAGIGGGYTQTNFDATQNRDVERQDARAHVTYESRRGNEVAFVAEAQKREGNSVNNLGFDEFAVGPELIWKFSPSLQGIARIKYQERNPVDPALSAFDGLTGLLSLRWSLSDRIAISGRLQRLVSSLGDQLSNFAIVDRQELAMEWNISRRLGYYIRGEREVRDFELEPSLLPAPDIAPRKDTIISGRVGAWWAPKRRLRFEATAGLGDRSSNRQFRDFRYELYVFEFQYNFL